MGPEKIIKSNYNCILLHPDNTQYGYMKLGPVINENDTLILIKEKFYHCTNKIWNIDFPKNYNSSIKFQLEHIIENSLRLLSVTSNYFQKRKIKHKPKYWMMMDKKVFIELKSTNSIKGYEGLNLSTSQKFWISNHDLLMITKKA